MVSPAAEMSFWDHLEELRFRLRRVIIVLLVLFAIFVVFGFRPVAVDGVTVPVPYPEGFALERTLSGRVLIFVIDYVVPPAVNVTVLTPWEAIIVHLKVGFFLSLAAAMPYIGYQFGKFIGPGLYANERRLILRLAIPVAILFVLGALLALLVLLPFIFDFLYGAAAGLGLDLLLLSLDELIDFVILFMVGFGLAFQLPVVMYVLAAAGLVTADFWKRNWRFAAVGIFLFGALITPDSSGVTMFVVSLPILALYGVGYLSARAVTTKGI